jgi:hypothetical protein
MRFHLELDRVSLRGTERLRDQVVWPAWFAVDDSALRYLAGDASVTGVVQTPGPRVHWTKAGIASWDRTISTNAFPAEDALVGFGLLLSTGGTDSAPVWETYQELGALLHAFALSKVARSSQIAALLAAFGGATTAGATDDKALLAQLREGIGLCDLQKVIDGDLLAGIAALRGIGQVLGGLLPGPSHSIRNVDLAADRMAAAAELVRPTVRELADSLAESGVRASPSADDPARLRPELPFREAGPAALGGISNLPVGTIVAATVQAWRLSDLPPGRPLSIDRPLRVLGPMRASLVLHGSIHKEG